MDKKGIYEAIRRAETERTLKEECLGSISERVDRWLEIHSPTIVPNTHFASASAECILLYRDGYFFACIALCQAIDEAMVRLICEKNGKGSKGYVGFKKNIHELKALKDEIPADWIEAFERIWKDRNDYHHLNPKVPAEKGKLREIAKDKIITLLGVESKVFAFQMVQGAISPKYPRYWDKSQEGLLNVYLRLE